MTTATSPPDGFIVTASSTDSVTLEWSAPRISPRSTLDHYVVEYVQVDSKTKVPVGSIKEAR